MNSADKTQSILDARGRKTDFAAALAAMDQDLMRALMVAGSFFQTFAERTASARSALSAGDAPALVIEAQQRFVEEYARQHRILFAKRWEPSPEVFFDGPEPPPHTAHLHVRTFEGKSVDREAAVLRMDSKIRADIMRDRPVHDEAFFQEYARRHAKERAGPWEPAPGLRIQPVYRVETYIDERDFVWWESAPSPRKASDAVAAEISSAKLFDRGHAETSPGKRVSLTVRAVPAEGQLHNCGERLGVFDYEWGGYNSPPRPIRSPHDRMAALVCAATDSREHVEIQEELERAGTNDAAEQAPDSHLEAAHDDSVNCAGNDSPQWDEQFEECTTHGEGMER